MRALSIERGQRFGRLIVIQELKPVREGKSRTRRVFKLKCDCGGSCVVRLNMLTNNHTQSCGCLKINHAENSRVRTHGRSRDPIYAVWRGMLDRCGNPNHDGYPNYGERGIKVCKRWRKFKNFLVDMGERPSAQHELNRIDNDRGYRPGNVEWTDDASAQARNRRKQKRKRRDHNV